MCPLLAPHFKPFLFFLAVAINSTNEEMQYLPFSSLYYLDVYGTNQANKGGTICP
jgi:hypothetical protein